ncbi:uncharacterized protein LOC119400861 [Rhipicephalus sanguineus]|uniref:uncharacterized protein LOC119400861 n=1 Tax=Rhipicephalus sanguineus TaxID=34632 RepID=UPI0018959F70|nr:uncharacterized protein LOC119400861 [Rhipicephalus sanguineus]
MALLLIVVILACKEAYITDACADSARQVPRFCWGGQYLNQLYCPDIKNKSQWRCFGGSSVGCACKTLYRAMDGQCVELNQCAAHAHSEPDIRRGTRKKAVEHIAPKTPGETTDTPPNTVAVPVNSHYDAAKQLIQHQDVLELLMMSLESYAHDDCICLKSTRIAETITGAERTIECYAYRKHLKVPDTIANVEGSDKLLKITREVEVTVENTEGKTKVYLKPAPRPNGISEADKSLFGLFNEYDVVVAETTCVTLAFGASVDAAELLETPQ